eukprot:253500_1
MSWESKKVKSWSTTDLCDWVRSIGLSEAWQKIMITAIEDKQKTGSDFFYFKSGKNLGNSLDIIQTMLSNRLYRELKKVKEKQLKEATARAVEKIGYVAEDNEQKEFELQMFGQSKYWKFDKKVNKNTSIRFVKALWKAEAAYTASISSFYLIGKRKTMSNNKTLGECGITNERRVLNVQFTFTSNVSDDFSMIVDYLVKRHEDNNSGWTICYDNLKSKYDKECSISQNVTQWVIHNPDIDFRTWNSDVIIYWLKNIIDELYEEQGSWDDKKFDKNYLENEFRKILKDKGITGNDLISFSKNDFRQFGLVTLKKENFIDCIVQKIAQLTQRENENYKLKQEMKILKQQFVNKEKQLNKLQNDNNGLKKEISSKDTKLRQITMNIISSKDEYNLLLAQVASLKEENNNLKQRNRNKELKTENKAYVNTNKILIEKK